MRTGDGKKRPGLLTALAIVGILVSLTGCEEITDPEVAVALDSSSETVQGTKPVQIFATVTEDGKPLTSNQVMFTTTRGTFTGGGTTSTKATDDSGLAAETLTLSDDTDTTPVDVSATSSTDLSTFTATLTLPVEAGGGR